MKELLVKVKSSNIAEIGYDAGTAKILYIRFIGGGLYSYAPFTAKDFAKFKKAKSKGKWFHKHIKDNTKFEVVKVSD